MTRGIVGTGLLLGLALAWTGAAAQSPGPTVAPDAAPSARPASFVIEGRYAVTSDAGGAVWAFQPGGMLMLVGPGDLVAAGSWQPVAGQGWFDASVDVRLTGQRLTVLGALAPDGVRIALHVRASEPRSPENGVPWPPVSRLVGERLGMVTDGAVLAPGGDECLRPTWESSDVVVWEPCLAGPTGTSEASIAPVSSPAPASTPASES